MGRYLCLEPVLPVAMRFHASRSAVTSALASPMGSRRAITAEKSEIFLCKVCVNSARWP